jgi:hypothetical protein
MASVGAAAASERRIRLPACAIRDGTSAPEIGCGVSCAGSAVGCSCATTIAGQSSSPSNTETAANRRAMRTVGIITSW